MSNYRVKKDNLIPENSIMTKGTSAEFIGVNKLNNRKGIHKQNGCMLGVYHEDVREKLASQIFDMLRIPHADIELIYDDKTKENSCFSYYIINDNEKLESPTPNKYDPESVKSVQNYINNYCESVKSIEGITEEDIPAIKKNLAQMLYMDCILDHYDRKDDNMELVVDKDTGKYIRTSPWYDYGVAFQRESLQQNGIFQALDNKEVMQQLFENYFDDIQDLHKNVKENITPKYIKELLHQEYCIDTLGDGFTKEIEDNINMRVEQAEKMYNIENEKKIEEAKLQKQEETVNAQNQIAEYKPNFFQRIINKVKEKFTSKKSKIDNKEEIFTVQNENIEDSKKDEFKEGLQANVNVDLNIQTDRTINRPNNPSLGR